jgi:hypothetical protein
LIQLHSINPNSSQLEKTNVLMKLRETILDNHYVTSPDDISIFPNNLAYFLSLCFATLFAFIGFVRIICAIIIISFDLSKNKSTSKLNL